MRAGQAILSRPGNNGHATTVREHRFIRKLVKGASRTEAASTNKERALILKPGPRPIAKLQGSRGNVSARPEALENERQLLGVLMLGTPESEAAFAQLGPLKTDHFTDPRNRIIFDAILNLHLRRHDGCKYAVDVGTVFGELRHARRLKVAGGKSYLDHLGATAPRLTRLVGAIVDAGGPVGAGTQALAAVPVQITERHKTSQTTETETLLDRLDALDVGLMQIGMEFPSWTDEQIGNHFGMSREAINRRRNRPAYRALISKKFQVGIEAATEQLNFHASAVVQQTVKHALSQYGCESLQACKALLPYILPKRGNANGGTSKPGRGAREISVREKRSRTVEREVRIREKAE